MANYHQPPLAFIRHITLQVNDAKKMTEFYTWLGMRIIHQSEKETILGTKNPLLTLKHDRVYPLETKATQGLYHVAYLLPSREALGTVLKYLIQSRYPLQGLSDHGVSEAIYLVDPEGNGIEIYADRPPMLWPYEGKTLAMVTEMMKYQEVLTLAKPFKGLPEETMVGHLHLHVGDIQAARQFYLQQLGYQHMQDYGDSASFLSTGGYHHHLGINTWRGVNIPPKNPNTTGIIGFTVYGQRPSFKDIAGLSVDFKS